MLNLSPSFAKYSLTRGKEEEKWRKLGAYRNTGPLRCHLALVIFFFRGRSFGAEIDNDNEWLHMFVSGRVSMSFNMATRAGTTVFLTLEIAHNTVHNASASYPNRGMLS